MAHRESDPASSRSGDRSSPGQRPPRNPDAAGARGLSAGRFDALVRLLTDDDPAIVSVARDELALAAREWRPRLVECARRHDDPRVRVKARQVLRDIARKERLVVWEAYATGPDPLDLERGSFLIGHVQHPDIDLSPRVGMLDDMASVLEKRISLNRDPEAVVARLSHLLFTEIGFRGNRQEYYDPQNSYLHRVLDRKRGIPISLSVVAMLVARRIGLSLDGIGLPGHFILRYRSGRNERYFDPFNRGRAWSLEDCLQHLRDQGYGFDERYLRPYSPREILIRMLANLLTIHRSRQDERATQRLTDMLVALNPDSGRRPPGA